MATDKQQRRDLVLISGYYGFGNLGDEAILEQLTRELKTLVAADNITVLSQNPRATERLYGVHSANRWDLVELIALLKRARLFISGGGGLFQDTASPGSVLYYGGQIMTASLLHTPTLVYAQGIGPIASQLAVMVTKAATRMAQSVCVRDWQSLSFLEQWGIPAQKTADPVWCLDPTPLPESLESQLKTARTKTIVGLSLRTSSRLSPEKFARLALALRQALPADAAILPLPLQKEQDQALLLDMCQRLNSAGFPIISIDTGALERPSQWLSLIQYCDVVVSMRLHALIMALKWGKPVIGIAYDPKVTHLLTEFEQPSLNLTNDGSQELWADTLKAAFKAHDELSKRASLKAEAAKNLACQNFNILARILNMQRDS